MAHNSCTTASGENPGPSFREALLRHCDVPMDAVAIQLPAIELLLEVMYDKVATAKPGPVGRRCAGLKTPMCVPELARHARSQPHSRQVLVVPRSEAVTLGMLGVLP